MEMTSKGAWLAAMLAAALLAPVLGGCKDRKPNGPVDEKTMLEVYWAERQELPPMDAWPETPYQDGNLVKPPADGGGQVTPPADGGQVLPLADAGQVLPPEDGEEPGESDGEYETPHMAAGQFEVIAKARPDECFDQIGGEYVCAAGRAPNKVNQAYLWGMAQNGGDIWFGTAPNMVCYGMGGPTNPIGPHVGDAWACEYERSHFIDDFNQLYPNAADKIPLSMGDWRPPQIFRYDALGNEVEMTGRITAAADLYRLHHTFGLRSAGAIRDLIFLAGPSTLLGPLAGYEGIGINVFVFRRDGTFLGSQTFPDYNDIRRWLVVGEQLYTGVGRVGGGGAVLRLVDVKAAPFEIVLEDVFPAIDGGAADLAEHAGRLFVSTWPNMDPQDPVPTPFGLWMSPALTAEGLIGAGAWRKVWQADDYEPDPVVAVTYAGGALKSYGGYLYFSTMHMPFVAALAQFEVYGYPAEGDYLEYLTTILGTHRPTAIFRGGGFGTPDEKIEVLYGERLLPVRNPLTGSWELRQNRMPDPDPLFGHGGFGNFFNTYTWSMEVQDGKLWVGTFDWGYPMLHQVMIVGEKLLGMPLPELPALPMTFGFGADLFYFRSTAHKAHARSIDGAGNYTNYGIRNMLNLDDTLYLGTANPMNLMTDPHDGNPEGGWELIRVK